MKITKIEVYNFGRFSDQSFDLYNGCNMFLENNGWGKSTLVSFLKVMFYGFSENSSSGANERAFYKPWQGGTFGGKIIFEAGGKEYTLERIFEDNAKDDIFCLTDKEGKESKDFSENIGEELFKIDAESFKRTVLIKQNDIETYATDAVNKRINSLTDIMDDIKDFDAVSNKLYEDIDKISPDNPQGELNIVNTELEELQKKLIDPDKVCSQYRVLQNALIKEREILQDKENEVRQLEQDKEYATKFDAMFSKKSKYSHITREYEKRKSAFDNAQKNFPNGIPAEKDIDNCIEKSRSIIEKDRLCASTEPTSNQIQLLNEKAKSFEVSGIPSEEDMEELFNKATAIEEKEVLYNSTKVNPAEVAELENLSATYGRNEALANNTKTLIDSWDDRTRRASKVSLRKSILEKVQNSEEVSQSSSKLWLIFIILGTIFSLIGAVFGLVFYSSTHSFNTQTIVVVLAAFGIGIGLYAGGIISKVKADRKKASGLPVDTDETKLMSKEIIEEERLINKTDNAVKEFLSSFGLEFNEQTVMASLYTVKGNFDRYFYLSDKLKDRQGEELLAQIEEEKLAVEKYLRNYSLIINPLETLKTQVINLRMDAKAYKEAKELKTKNDAYKAEYLKEVTPVAMYLLRFGLKVDSPSQLVNVLTATKQNLLIYNNAKTELDAIMPDKLDMDAAGDYDDVMAFNMNDEMKSLEEIEKLLTEDKAKIKELYSSIQLNESKRNMLLELKSQLDRQSVRLAELEAKKNDLTVQYELLLKTKQLITKSKDNFVEEYSRPVAKKFKKYFNLINDSNKTTKYSFDENGNLVITDNGVVRDIHAYSAGCQDKINLCLRLALIDTMYENELPVLVMDDPFVNLDEDTLESAKKIVLELSKKYQIVYLTCHSSRAIA